MLLGAIPGSGLFSFMLQVEQRCIAAVCVCVMGVFVVWSVCVWFCGVSVECMEGLCVIVWCVFNCKECMYDYVLYMVSVCVCVCLFVYVCVCLFVCMFDGFVCSFLPGQSLNPS